MFEGVEAFYRPANVREAVRLLHNAKGKGRIVAGSTDAILDSGPSVRVLIDITHAGLSYIRRRTTTWTIGATTTMAELEESPAIQSIAGGLLARAAATCGSMQIRNMATLGGNMSNGSPAADLAAPLLALDASVSVADTSGRHKMSLSQYLAMAAARHLSHSILAEVMFPEPPHGHHCGWSFRKFGRTAVDISIVNVAAGLQLDTKGRVKWARIALGAVSPIPMRAAAAEELMTGQLFDRALIGEAAE